MLTFISSTEGSGSEESQGYIVSQAEIRKYPSKLWVEAYKGDL